MPYLERKLPEPGETIGGKYRVVRKIGEGGMGVVFEAMHERIQQRVALKMLLPEVLEIPDVVSRFEREARAAGQLRSEHAARVIDVDITPEGIPYMVMEYLEGNDLSKILDAHTQLPIAESVDYVLQACSAMAEAHALGIIHRDLKPSNLFLCGGDRPVVKVLDFGISKLQNDKDTRVTATQATVGTPLYMSPEQIRSAKHVDTRTDIWSLSIILYELLAGKTPFEGSTAAAAAAICIDQPPPLSSFRSDIPPELEKAILSGLAKNPSDRLQDVHALAAAIAPYGSGGIRAPRISASSSGAFPPGPLSRPRLDTEAKKELVSARTMAAASEPRGSGGRSNATLPGWTTKSGSSKSKNRLFLVATLASLSAAAVAGVVVFLATRPPHEAVSTPATPVITAPAASIPITPPQGPPAIAVTQLPSVATTVPPAVSIRKPAATPSHPSAAPAPSSRPAATPTTPSTAAPIHI